MQPHEIVQQIMFDYESLSREQIVELCGLLPRKIVRWMGAHHPDNRTRKIFFELTNVEVGEGVILNPNLIVSDGYHPLLKIGKRAALGPNVTIICESAPDNSLLRTNEYVTRVLTCLKPVIISEDVWVGANVVILPGVTIGRGAIIAAGTVVNQDVPPCTIAAGVPARFIHKLDPLPEAP
jgi:maltose O-acetyltransferase